MKTRLWMLALMAILLVIPFTVMNASAQKKDKKDDAGKKKSQSFELKAMKVETGRGSTDDPNIKNNSMANTENQEFAAPKEKQGNSTARGSAGVCKVVLDNQTNLRINIYVDGSFRGTMAPYGDSVTYTGAGPTRVYARAEFEDGSALYWGPTDYTCYDGQFINFKMVR